MKKEKIIKNFFFQCICAKKSCAKMKKYLALLLIALLTTSYAIGEASLDSDASRASNIVKKSALEKFDELRKKAIEHVGAIKNIGAPRKIKRGSFPEIVLKQDKIYFDNKELNFGQSMESWKKVISGRPRCSGGGMTLCIWDDLGLYVGTDDNLPQKVKFFNIEMSVAEDDIIFRKENRPGGSTAGKYPDLSPHQVFPGYLELDGFGIDAKTKLWEVRNAVDVERNINCGLSDCSHPRGVFAKNVLIYMLLDGRSEQGRLREFSLNAVDLKD